MYQNLSIFFVPFVSIELYANVTKKLQLPLGESFVTGVGTLLDVQFVFIAAIDTQ